MFYLCGFCFRVTDFGCMGVLIYLLDCYLMLQEFRVSRVSSIFYDFGDSLGFD